MRRPRRKRTAEGECRGCGNGIADARPNKGTHSTPSRISVWRMGARTPSSSASFFGSGPTAAGIAKRPSSDTSSFWESRHAMLGLALYAERTKDPRARDAAMRAAEVFLSRQLFLERHSGRVMNPEFVRLHYPLYYGYDILGGLKAMAEIGRIDDPRCEKALDLLEEKQLPGGGWAAERRLYAVSSSVKTRAEDVDWGGGRPRGMNEWGTADRLHGPPAA